MGINATISISLDDYQVLQDGRKTAEAEAEGLRKQLAEARMADPENRVRSLAALSRAAIEVVRFAVGNIPPESMLKWPGSALTLVAELIPTLPDYGTDDRELASEFRSFAREISSVAAQRAAKAG